jgi:hypothetical protein
MKAGKSTPLAPCDDRRARFFGSTLLSIMTDFTDLGKQADAGPVRVLRMIVRKLFLELHGIIGLKPSIRPIP